MADLEEPAEPQQNLGNGQPLYVNVFGTGSPDGKGEEGGVKPVPPGPTPEPTFFSDEDGEEDTLPADLMRHRKSLQAQAQTDEFESMFGLDTREPDAAATAKPKEPVEPKTPGAGFAMDVAKGLASAPTQALGGARDAGQAMIEGLNDMANWVVDKLPDPNEEDGVAALGAEGYAEFKKKRQGKAPIQLPEVRPPDTVTGGLIRGVSQFLTGFAAGGMALKSVKVAGTVAGMPVSAGKAATAAKAAAQGAIGDFTAFEAHEKRLANVLKENLGVKNAFVEWLSAKEEDRGTLEGRLKNVVEGAVGGVLAEGFIRGVKTLYKGAGDFAQRIMARVEGVEVKPKEVAKESFAVLGNPDGDLLEPIAKAEFEKGSGEAGKQTPQAVRQSPSGKKQFYINFARINSFEDVMSVMQNMATKGEAEIEAAARGKRTHQQTIEAAKKENAFKLLLERRRGEPLNAEQTKAIRDLWEASGRKLAEVAETAAATPSEENLFAFMKMKEIHSWVQQGVLAVRREQARALNQWAIPAGGNKEMLIYLQNAIEGSGGMDVAQALAKKIAAFARDGRAVEMEKMVEGSFAARSMDAVSQLFYFSLLSGPQSHVANVLSNMSFAFQQIFERRYAEHLSQAWGTEGAVAAGEAAAMYHGLITGMKEALVALRQMSKEELVQGVTDIVKGTGEATAEGAVKHVAGSTGKGLSAAAWGARSTTPWGRFLDMMDVATRTPTRLLGAADDVFKGAAKRMELHAQALRTATHELKGAKPDPAAFEKRIAELVQNPTRQMMEAVEEQAAYQTFTNRPEGAIKEIADKLQKFPILGRLFLPFKNTPINILNTALERTPMAPMVKRWRADVAAGGARRDMALSRTATGSMIMALAIDAAMKGQITGNGSAHPGRRALDERSKRQKYSIKLGDKYVQYSRLDPVGWVLGIGADIAEAMQNAGEEIGSREFEEVLAVSSFAVSETALTKTYLKGLAEVFDAVNNPKMQAYNYLKRLTGMVVPTGAATVTRQIDPVRRTAESLVDGIRRRIPTISVMGKTLINGSESLAAYRDLWGRTTDFRSGMGALVDMINPVYTSTEKQEPIDRELEEIRFFPAMPNRVIRQDGVQIRLNAHQMDRYQELAGNALKHPTYKLGLMDFLNKLVDGKSGLSSLYKYKKNRDAQEGTDTAKDYIQHWINEYRGLARAQLFREDGALREELKAKTKDRKGLMPVDVRFRQR